MLTPEQLQAIRERAERATAGPWATCKSEDGQFIDRKARFHYDHAGRVLIESPTHCKDHIVADASCNNTCIEIMEQEDNADFIAHARTDIPDLLSHIDELEAKLAMPDISDADVINTSLSMQQQYELEQKIPKDLSKFKISITRKP